MASRSQKEVLVQAYNDLHSRMTNIQTSANSRLFGDDAAARDAARAQGLRAALQYLAEHVYTAHGFDLEYAATAAREAGAPVKYRCPQCGAGSNNDRDRTCPSCGHNGDWVQVGV